MMVVQMETLPSRLAQQASATVVEVDAPRPLTCAGVPDSRAAEHPGQAASHSTTHP